MIKVKKTKVPKIIYNNNEENRNFSEIKQNELTPMNNSSNKKSLIRSFQGFSLESIKKLEITDRKKKKDFQIKELPKNIPIKNFFF